MCLLVSDKSVTPLTATKPIKVYKVLTSASKDKWITPVMGKKVRFVFGKCNMGNNLMRGIVYYSDFGYYHVYWEKGELSVNFDSLFESIDVRELGIKDVCVHQGIHAYTDKSSLLLNEKNAVFEAVIPKGAHYFIGAENEIVADKMIIYKNGVKDTSIEPIENE